MPGQADLIVRNGTVVTNAGRREVDIAVGDGIFAAIEPRGSLAAAAKHEIDARGLIVLPGVIDGHVHFRQPGLEYKEDWQSGSRAAVMGGVTTVLEMPNTVPPTETVAAALAKVDLARAGAHCDFAIFGLVGTDAEQTARLARSRLVAGLKVFLGPTTGVRLVPDDRLLRHAMGAARATGLRVGFHAEDEGILRGAEERLVGEGRRDPPAHLAARPVEAEVAAIEHAGRLLAETGATGHIFHLSSLEGIAAVERWRERGVDLTCEATPQHALLGVETYRHAGGVARINPPVRGEPHASALLAALAGGTIDCWASDHSPHTAAEKVEADIWRVPSGFAGVETMLRLLLTGGVDAGRPPLERLAYITSEGPARTWGLWPRKGAIAVGSDADLTIVDLAAEGTIRAAELHGKNNLTPFEGWPTRGAAVATIVRGKIVMRDGRLLGEPGWGRSVAPRVG